MMQRRMCLAMAFLCALPSNVIGQQAKRAVPEYRTSTLAAHMPTSAFTWSHGEMLAKNGCAGVAVTALVASERSSV